LFKAVSKLADVNPHKPVRLTGPFEPEKLVVCAVLNVLPPSSETDMFACLPVVFPYRLTVTLLIVDPAGMEKPKVLYVVTFDEFVNVAYVVWEPSYAFAGFAVPKLVFAVGCVAAVVNANAAVAGIATRRSRVVNNTASER
jgi:hypothetical protein